MYRPQNVFSLKQMIGSGVMGIRRSKKVVWPQKPDLLNDDLYISAMGLHYDRMVLTDLRYAPLIAKTWTGVGGMQGQRTVERMLADEHYLKAVFGSDAIRRRTESFWTTVKSEYQLQLTVRGKPMYDVKIVGAGLAGCIVAERLAAAGCRVLCSSAATTSEGTASTSSTRRACWCTDMDRTSSGRRTMRSGTT